MTDTTHTDDRFTDDRAAGWWISDDGQGQMDMRGQTIGEAWDMLLQQCADEDDEASILAGTVEPDEDGTR